MTLESMTRPADGTFSETDDAERRHPERTGIPDWVVSALQPDILPEPADDRTEAADELLPQAPPMAEASTDHDDDPAGDGKHGRSSPADGHPDVTAQEARDKFSERIGGARLIYDFRTSKITGLATWDPDTWDWQVTELESPAERVYRDAGIDLLTGLVTQATGVIAMRPTDLDQAVAAARDVIDPTSIALQLCNSAVQALAYHCGIGFAAPVLGPLAEQLLTPLVAPPGPISGVLEDLQVFDVTADAATGQLTPAVYGFAAAQLGALTENKTHGISQAELDTIGAAIRQGQASVRKPGTR